MLSKLTGALAWTLSPPGPTPPPPLAVPLPPLESCPWTLRPSGAAALIVVPGPRLRGQWPGRGPGGLSAQQGTCTHTLGSPLTHTPERGRQGGTPPHPGPWRTYKSRSEEEAWGQPGLTCTEAPQEMGCYRASVRRHWADREGGCERGTGWA